MKKNGKIVLDGFIKGQKVSEVHPVIEKMIEVRILVRLKMGSDYERETAASRQMLEAMIDEQKTTAINAMMQLVKEMEVQSAEQGIVAPIPKMLVMAAALDLAEKEVGWFETDDDLPEDAGFLG